MCYPAHSPVFTHLRVGFEKSQKIVIFWIFLHPSLDEQYGKIGFPNNKDLSSSSDVVSVHEYTRDDGTVVKAHYRSKAGEGDPNKAVMQSLGEYKTEIEKEIDKFMTQDAYNRYGENAIIGNKQKTETEENEQQDNIDYAAFYPGGTAIQQLSESDDLQNAFSVDEINIPEEKYSPSEKLLTGGIEISRDLDNEIPAVEYRKEPNREIPLKKQQEPKYSPNYKPYTGRREMNLSNIILPETKLLGNLDDLTNEYRRKNEYQNINDKIQPKQIDKVDIQTLLNELLLTDQNLTLKDKIGNAAALQMELLTNPIQAAFAKNVTTNKLTADIFKSPLSLEYYRLSLDPINFMKDDSDNEYTDMRSMDNSELKQHLTNMHLKINDKTLVVKPKYGSPLINQVKASTTLQNFIVQHKDAIKSGNYKNKNLGIISFYGVNDLDTLLGTAHIYNTYIDNNGNLHLQIPDYYDFNRRKWKNWHDAGTLINNNAWMQQQYYDRLTNYILLLDITYTKQELAKIPGW